MGNNDLYQDEKRDVIVSIRGVEPGLLNAVQMLEKRLGRPLKGIDVVDAKAVSHKYYLKDETGFFEQIVCDFDDPDQLQQALKPYMDSALLMTCRLEEAMKDYRRASVFLPYINTPTEASLDWCTQKRLMRDRLRAYDPALVPKYENFHAYEAEKVTELIQDFAFPVIVKPTGLYASLLVNRCDDMDELHACLERTFELIEEAYERGDGTGAPSVLVEEMMQGPMYSVDAYIGARGEFYALPPVEVITAHAAGLSGFYGYRYILPSGLTDEQLQEAYAATEASGRALNLRSTVIHVELFLTETGWKIIELGPRIGGYREALYREAYGIEHRYNELAIRIGLPPEIPTTPRKHAAAIAIYADEEGIITDIAGLEEARRLSSVVSVSQQAYVGDMSLFAESGGEMIADAVLSNEDPEQLEADVAKVRELVRITVEPRSE